MGLSWGGGNVWDVQMQWFEGWVGAAGLGDACPCLGGVEIGVVHLWLKFGGRMLCFGVGWGLMTHVGLPLWTNLGWVGWETMGAAFSLGPAPMGGKHRCMQAPLACRGGRDGACPAGGGVGVGVGLKLNPKP